MNVEQMLDARLFGVAGRAAPGHIGAFILAFIAVCFIRVPRPVPKENTCVLFFWYTEGRNLFLMRISIFCLL